MTFSLGIAGLAALPPSPALADGDEFVPTTAVVRTSWGYVDQHDPLGGYPSPTGDAPVGAWWQGEPPAHHMARSYFTFDLARFHGARILRATLLVRETQANDCAARDVQLWETEPFTGLSSWIDRPAELRLLAAQGPPEAGCLVTDGRIDVAGAVTGAIGRGQRSITLGLRVSAEHEGDTRYGRRFAANPAVEVVYNNPPETPTGEHLHRQYGPDVPCTTAGPGDWFNPDTANDARAPVFGANVADPDPGDNLVARFAVWPVADPGQRWELPWPVQGTPTYAQLNDPPLTDGQTYAWTVRGEDGTDVSPWGRTCYFTIDRTPPGTPSADSPLYRNGDQFAHRGGVGVPGEFTFTADGTADVTAYEYRLFPGDGEWLTVPAGGLGGPATITFSPAQSGYHTLSVRAVDRALNRSWSGGYAFTVRENRPSVYSDLYPPFGTNPAGGIGVPGVFRFSPGLPDVVEYGYRLDGGPAATVAADATGRAQATITPTSGGWHSLLVTNTTRDGVTPPPIEYRFRVDTMPSVRMSPSPVVIGSTATFTFTTRVPGASHFVYWFESALGTTPPATAPLGPDGTAAVPWTPTQLEWVGLRVQTFGPDSVVSEVRQFDPPVDRAEPTVTVVGADAPGVPGTLTFRTRMSNVVEYDYWFTWNAADRITVPAGPDGTATVAWTPLPGASYRVTVVARNAAGVESGRGSRDIPVSDHPRVSSAEFPGNGSAVPRRHGSFTFAPRQLNVVEYEYTINEDDLVTRRVPAGPDGTATVPWTPPREGSFQLIVRSRDASGAMSRQTFYYIYVSSQPTVSSPDYPRGCYCGGPGETGTFTFAPATFDVVAYDYWLFGPDGSVEQLTVPAGPDGTATITWTPVQPDWHDLIVRSRSADGYESEWAGYYFIVAYPPEE